MLYAQRRDRLHPQNCGEGFAEFSEVSYLSPDLRAQCVQRQDIIDDTPIQARCWGAGRVGRFRDALSAQNMASIVKVCSRDNKMGPKRETLRAHFQFRATIS